MNATNSKGFRACRQCAADISARHYLAALCFACAKSWGDRTGASKATAAVREAVRRGQLAKARQCACADCGSKATDYDHRDYNKPLEVQPVCRSCNKKRGPAIPAQEIA